jgi:enoyl reductase-like protein
LLFNIILYSDGEIHLDTPFSRLLGKPPIMVAGMTPSTVKAGFVSAVLDAGYHVELAGGGHYNAAALRSKVAEIQKHIPAGVGITLNSSYINPRQFTFQLPLWQKCARRVFQLKASVLLPVFLPLRKLSRLLISFVGDCLQSCSILW